MIDVAQAAATAQSAITPGDLLAAGVTVFCLIIIPLVVWLLRVVLNEAKRRTTDSLNLASIAKSNNELSDKFSEYADKTDQRFTDMNDRVDQRFGAIGERVARLEAMSPPSNGSRPH